MPKYKNIRVKKPNGGSRMQRVQVLASGKYKFVKNKGRTKTSRKRARSTARRAAPRRRRTYVARRRKRGSRRKGMGIRIGATIGMVAGLYGAYSIWKQYKGNSTILRNKMILGLTGYDDSTGNWALKNASVMLPIAAGVGVSMVASKIGMNRYTPRGINI